MSKSKFLILANARSGSTSLAKLLNESVDVNLCMEPFHPKYSLWNPGERNYLEYIRDENTLNKAVEEIYTHHNAMKVLVYQMPKKIYLSILARKEIKIIFLRRINLAQAALSSQIGEQTSIWHKEDMDEEKYNTLKPIEVPVLEEIVRFVSDKNMTYSDFLDKNRPSDHLDLFYENLYSEDSEKNLKTVTEICSFLNVQLPPKEAIDKWMKPTNSKQNQNDLYKKVPNLEEIETHFPGIFDPTSS
jgi:LPS sulfotransferase NodH